MMKSSTSLAAAIAFGSVLFFAARYTEAQSRATVCSPNQYGAKADGKTKDTNAIQAAIDECARKGGGVVRLASGIFLTGPIVLKSHIRLEVDTGATLLGSQDTQDYPQVELLREAALQPLVSATNAEDITITGGGTVDGAGQPWWEIAWANKGKPKSAAALRPRLVVFDHCRHVLIDGATIQNSASWQVVLYYSDDVTIRNTKILAPARSPNTDGVDPFSSRNITISHVLIDVGDDNVAIKSGQPGSTGPDDPSTGITVTDSEFLHGHGMSIGSEVAGGVNHVRVERVHFKGTDNGIRVKSNRDRGNDIGNLEFRDITMEDVKTPILISEYYPKIPDHDAPQQVTRLTPRFHDIKISNLTATGAQTGGYIVGLPESPIRSIALDHIHIVSLSGMTLANVTVTTHDFTVQSQSGPSFLLRENAEIRNR